MTTSVRESRPLETMPIGVVMRRAPGVTRWAAWSWRAVAVLPGAPAATGRVLRDAAGVRETHAATLPLNLWRGETEAYRTALSNRPPRVWVVSRGAPGAEPAPILVTASPYEGSDYQLSDEDRVDAVPMPDGLAAWVAAFVDAHHRDQPFVKRRRDRAGMTGPEGVGDPRVRQGGDVYRAPTARRDARATGAPSDERAPGARQDERAPGARQDERAPGARRGAA